MVTGRGVGYANYQLLSHPLGEMESKMNDHPASIGITCCQQFVPSCIPGLLNGNYHYKSVVITVLDGQGPHTLVENVSSGDRENATHHVKVQKSLNPPVSNKIVIVPR